MEQHGPPSAAVLAAAVRYERFFGSFRERLAERFYRYSEEWMAEYRSQQDTQHGLAAAYARHGVDFGQEVSLLLAYTYWKFVHFLAYKRAIKETGKEFRATRKRYRVHVRVLTTDTAPFPDDWKAFGQEHWRILDALDFEALLRQRMHEDLGDDTAFIRGNPLRDNWHTHPAWKNFEVWLIELLTHQHRLSERLAFNLVSRTLKHFLGPHFSAKEGAAAVRLRIRRQAAPKK